MKKPLLIVIIILAVILILPAINLIRWSLQTKKPMGVIIVNKTVPSPDRIKHKSFNWVLTNNRFVKKDINRSYSYQKDYYGFVPTKPYKERQWDRNEYRLADLTDLAEQADAIFVTDTYGVFFNDWYQGVRKSRTSTKLYGGLNNNDNLLIKEMKDRDKLVILEYNSFDFPTAEFESYRIQERLNIKFDGWTGKYFSSLDTTKPDFPIWMTSMYRKQYRKPWTFTKPGIVILSQKTILVLEEGTQLKSATPVLVTDSEYCDKWNLPSSIPFDKWFDIIDPLDNKEISSFKLETTSIGDTLLADYGLHNSFPAIIQDPVSQRTYYFSGDFTSSEVPVWSAKFLGVEKLKGIMYSKKTDDPRRFFWLFYRPLIEGIFNDYYNSLSSN